MAEKIAFENGGISNFEGLVTFILTLDRVILHAVVHHSLTAVSTWQISLKLKFRCVYGRTDIRKHERTDRHLRPALLCRLCRRVELKTARKKCNTIWPSATRKSESGEARSRRISTLVKPRPYQQQCPSNLVECHKFNDSFDNVECCFDIVAVFGKNVAGFVLSTKSKQIEHVQFV